MIWVLLSDYLHNILKQIAILSFGWKHNFLTEKKGFTFNVDWMMGPEDFIVTLSSSHGLKQNKRLMLYL
jgi:hypothetical protein